jgi:2-polyprenyl-3-methyl-5-hydroxy-6-metoxy-1,4-benzoquinol methylase
MECVAVAVNMACQKDHRLEFSKLDMQARLGLGGEDVVILLDVVGEHAWNFSITSPRTNNLKKRLLHAQGHVCLHSPPGSGLSVAARLAQKRVQEATWSEAGERLKTKRAYDLFSRVVSYADFFKGISSITLHDTEAVATINTQPNQPPQNESPVTPACDAVVLDQFIQVVGLLINTSDIVSPDEVMVCTAMEHSTTTTSCDLASREPWTAHASYIPNSPTQATGDVFIFAPDGSLAAAFTGCRFTKVDICRLERILDSFGQPHKKVTGATPSQATQALQYARSDDPLEHSRHASSTPATDLIPTPQIEEDYLSLPLERYIRAVASDVEDGTAPAEISLDALTANKQATETAFSWNVDLDGKRLHATNMQERGIALPVWANGDPQAISTDDHFVEMVSSEETEAVVKNLLAEMTGASADAIKESMTLADIGVDSLTLIEFTATMPDLDLTLVEGGVVTTEMTIREILQAVKPAADSKHCHQPTSTEGNKGGNMVHLFPIPANTPNDHQARLFKARPSVLDIVGAIDACEKALPEAAAPFQLERYWTEVEPKQTELTLAYIKEAMLKQGIDLVRLEPGELVPEIPHIPKHSRLAKRLLEILCEQGIVEMRDGRLVASNRASGLSKDSATIYEELMHQYELYAVDARLVKLTGPMLAECLMGEVDATKLLFGSDHAANTLQEYYTNSPVLAVATAQVVTLITATLDKIEKPSNTTVRILEVGAGTGGTTRQLLEALAQHNVKVDYTFSDISPSLVTKAKRRFARFSSWVTFTKLDLEAPVSSQLSGMFDIIVSTNCVHATRDRTMVCARLRQMLSPAGFLALSEVTRKINFYDIVFGLLDGWWLSPRIYPLQPAEHWMKVLKNAGFCWTAFTAGAQRRLATQQLLVGCGSKSLGQIRTTGPTILTPMHQKHTEV